MAMHRARRIAATVASVTFALLMGAGGVLAGIYATQRPPVVIVSLQEVDGVAIRGGWLDMAVSLVRNRICDPKVDRWLWQWENGVKHWIALPIVPAPPVDLDQEAHYILSIPVPANVTPGQWNYVTRTHDDCPSVFSIRPETVRDGKNVLVTITDPTAAQPMQVVTPPGPVTISPLGK